MRPRVRFLQVLVKRVARREHEAAQRAVQKFAGGTNFVGFATGAFSLLRAPRFLLRREVLRFAVVVVVVVVDIWGLLDVLGISSRGPSTEV